MFNRAKTLHGIQKGASSFVNECVILKCPVRYHRRTTERRGYAEILMVIILIID